LALYRKGARVKAKPPNGGFANLSAAADQTFSKSRALVHLVQKARMMCATSGVAAERSESMAWMWEQL
jgi:hypothetical protein